MNKLIRSMCYEEDLISNLPADNLTICDDITIAMTEYVLNRLERVKSASAISDINPNFLFEDYNRTDMAFCLNSSVMVYPKTDNERAFASLFTCVDKNSRNKHDQCLLCDDTEGCINGGKGLRMWKTSKKYGLKPLLYCPDSMSLEEKYGGSYREERKMQMNSIPNSQRNLIAVIILSGPFVIFLLYKMILTVLQSLTQKKLLTDLIDQEKAQILQQCS